MSEFVTLRQGSPTVVIHERAVPTIVPSAQVEQVVVSRSGATYETQVINAPITNITEVTEVIEPEDPGDLTLLFNNRII